MPPETADMDELEDRDRDVLDSLAHGRANPKHLRELTELEKGEMNTVLVRLSRAGYVRQVSRGLYEITPDGLDALNKPYPEEIGYIKDMEIHDVAEDVKTVRFVGNRGVADVDVTDHTMEEFLATAVHVVERIEADKAAVEEIFREAAEGREE